MEQLTWIESTHKAMVLEIIANTWEINGYRNAMRVE